LSAPGHGDRSAIAAKGDSARKPRPNGIGGISAHLRQELDKAASVDQQLLELAYSRGTLAFLNKIISVLDTGAPNLVGHRRQRAGSPTCSRRLR
jgi:hypothetical protein